MANAMGWQRVGPDAPELPPVVLRSAGAEGHLPGRRRPLAAPVRPDRPRLHPGQRSRRRRAGRRGAAGRPPVGGAGDYEAIVRCQAARPRRDGAGDRQPRRWTSGSRRFWAADTRRPADPVARGGPARRAARATRASSSSSTTRSTAGSARSATSTRSTGSPTRRSAPARRTVGDADGRARRRGRAASPSPPASRSPLPAAPLAGVARARLRAGDRRPVRHPDPRRPRRHGDQGDDRSTSTSPTPSTSARATASWRWPSTSSTRGGCEVAHRLIATRRRRAPQHAHGRRRAPADRVRAGPGDQPAHRLLPHPRVRAQRAAHRAARATTRWARPSPARAYEAGGTHHGTPPIWQMLGVRRHRATASSRRTR